MISYKPDVAFPWAPKLERALLFRNNRFRQGGSTRPRATRHAFPRFAVSLDVPIVRRLIAPSIRGVTICEK